ncbi:MAG: hypothetical protein HC857_07780 [Synechococcales cyanobacterium RU_4_20]|nr:hypothetical protein [Synechococcales cyanobacterium RU_4_20]
MPTAPLLLILDTETSGINVAQHEVLEIAAVLYSVEHQCSLQQISTLIPTDLETNPAEAINRISIAAANATPPELSDYLCQTINYWGAIAQHVVAHNAEFDRKWFKITPSWLISTIALGFALATISPGPSSTNPVKNSLT